LRGRVHAGAGVARWVLRLELVWLGRLELARGHATRQAGGGGREGSAERTMKGLLRWLLRVLLRLGERDGLGLGGGARAGAGGCRAVEDAAVPEPAEEAGGLDVPGLAGDRGGAGHRRGDRAAAAHRGGEGAEAGERGGEEGGANDLVHGRSPHLATG